MVSKKKRLTNNPGEEDVVVTEVTEEGVEVVDVAGEGAVVVAVVAVEAVTRDMEADIDVVAGQTKIEKTKKKNKEKKWNRLRRGKSMKVPLIRKQLLRIMKNNFYNL